MESGLTTLGFFLEPLFFYFLKDIKNDIFKKTYFNLFYFTFISFENYLRFNVPLSNFLKTILIISSTYILKFNKISSSITLKKTLLLKI